MRIDQDCVNCAEGAFMSMVLWRQNCALGLLICASTAHGQVPSLPEQKPQLRIEAGIHMDPLTSMSATLDGRVLVTGSRDKTVRVWALPEGRLTRVLRVPIGRGRNEGSINAV